MKPMNALIREAEKRDAAMIVRLIEELAVSGGEHSPLTEAYVAKYLTSPVSTILLAEIPGQIGQIGQIVGLLSYSVRPDLYHAGDSCLVEELIVSEAFRGQGIGSALLTALITRLEAAGCAEVSVATMPDNAQAIRFYQKHGLTDAALFLEKHFGNR
jgi:ribosomal protein S18 acetylase RimI-like enzyme